MFIINSDKGSTTTAAASVSTLADEPSNQKDEISESEIDEDDEESSGEDEEAESDRSFAGYYNKIQHYLRAVSGWMSFLQVTPWVIR